MKYSISFLLLLTVIVALEVSLFKLRISEPILIVVGLSILLFWNRLTKIAIKTEGNVKSTIPDTVVTCMCVIGCVAPIHKMLFPSAAPLTWETVEKIRNVSGESVLILAVVMLANSFVSSPLRASSKPQQAVMVALFITFFFLFLTFVSGPGFWLVYMAVKGIEIARFDPHHILGDIDLLVFRQAFLKALFGLLGFALWFLLAALTNFRVQQKPYGCYSLIWFVAGLGCVATFLQWMFLLNDFPLLQEAIGAVLYQAHGFNVALISILSVAAFFQYCSSDRDVSQSNLGSLGTQPKWFNRFMGCAMLMPAVWLFSELAWRFFRMFFSYGFSAFDSLGWIFLLADLLELKSVMLIALFIIGIRVIVSASNDRARLRPLPPTAVLQLLGVAGLLVISLPLHLAACQFYFDAATTLSP